MPCLTCHQLCPENLPHPLTRTQPHYQIHTTSQHVLCPQSTSVEVTKQVAANKALRAQLQEKEDKLHQLQEKSVSHLFIYYFFLCVLFFFHLLCNAALFLFSFFILFCLCLFFSLYFCLLILFVSHP